MNGAELLKGYMSAYGESGTAQEQVPAQWLYERISEITYFKDRPGQKGLYPCPNDRLNRSIPWGFVKGKSLKTLVLFHHLDVVGTADFGMDQPWATEAETLMERYRGRKWAEEVRQDLNSGQWMFGRGSCDMKGGGIAQLLFFNQVAMEQSPEFSVLLLAVPDEENMSLGMRAAVTLLLDLKKQYGLEYPLAINAEPNFGQDDQALTVFTGSVGKATVLTYVQGMQCHAGTPYEGLSAVGVLSALVTATDGLVLERQRSCSAPPIAWTLMRDDKAVYDVSLPEKGWGTFNVLSTEPLKKTLDAVMNIFQKTVTELLEKRRLQHWHYTHKKQGLSECKGFDVPVMTYSQLQTAVHQMPEPEKQHFTKWHSDLITKASNGEITSIEATRRLIEKAIQAAEITEPVVVVALVPPVYPQISCKVQQKQAIVDVLTEAVPQIAGIPLKAEPYFMGICDLSYLGIDDINIPQWLPHLMPLWPEVYQLPLEKMEELQIPGINLGPRGKALHQKTERVYMPDVLDHLPKLYREIYNCMGTM